MRRFITPFLIICVVAGYISTVADEGEKMESNDTTNKESKLVKESGKPVSTFKDLEKMDKETVLVTVNGKPLTLDQAIINSRLEISNENSRMEQYSTDGEVQRELSQFISYTVFYDTFQVSDQEVTTITKQKLNSLVVEYGQYWAKQFLPDKEIIKYEIAEKKAIASNPTIDIEQKFRDSLTSADIHFNHKEIAETMKEVKYQSIKEFL